MSSSTASLTIVGTSLRVAALLDRADLRIVFLARNTMASTVSGFREQRSLLTRMSQAENTRSEGTEVAVMQRYFLAKVERIGNRSALTFHHSRVSMLLDAGRSEKNRTASSSAATDRHISSSVLVPNSKSRLVLGFRLAGGSCDLPSELIPSSTATAAATTHCFTSTAWMDSDGRKDRPRNRGSIAAASTQVDAASC